jgi:hypothetical protein
LYPEALMRSRNASSWTELQNGTTHHRNPMWEDVAQQFNDKDFHSGGLIVQHEELVSRKIDPEKRNVSGPIDGEHCYSFFFEIKKAYAIAYERFTRSGLHYRNRSLVDCVSLSAMGLQFELLVHQ